jgi:malonyl-CoA decarboxylase
MEGLSNFVTLSPVPGLMRWLQDHAPLTYDDCMNKNVEEDELMKKTFEYLTKSNRNDELPNDSVARFHLGNGAILKKVNLNADLSEKGINQSYGIMVNYLYDLDVVEENHELFFKTKEVVLSNEMKSFKKKNS